MGHIAVSLVLADLTKSDREAAVAGNLLPDVVDKTGSWVLHLMPSGRWLAHGLPFTGVTCLAARLFLDGPHWRGFVLGYTSHLVGDLWGGGKVPWFAPFEKAAHTRNSRLPGLWHFLPEVAGAAVIWALLRPKSAPPGGSEGKSRTSA